MLIRPGTETDVAVAAELHAAQITEGFLPTLGVGFLRRLYRRVVRSPLSFLHVAEEGEVTGAVAATEDLNALYRSFLVRDGIVAGTLAAPRLLRSWPRVWETLRYPLRGEDLPRAEILAVAVVPESRSRGVGRALVVAATEELTRRGVHRVRVVTASDNQPALRLYASCGFRPVTNVEIHRGTPSEVLTWS